MKTTSFLISKQLKEAGFEAEFNFHYKATDHCNLYDSGYEDYKDRNTPAYDLETILDTLPAFIEHNNITYDLWLWNDGIGYYPNYDKYSGEGVYNMENGIYEFSDNKSLADTAGRMWLELKEKNLL